MSVLKGKRAVISGSSRGIGRGIAIQFARAGAELVINYNSHPEEAEEVVAICDKVGGKAHRLQADMGDQVQVEHLIDESVKLLGGLDIVVSNAAYSDRHLMLESDLDEFRKTIDISMWGALYLVRRGAQKMVESGAGGDIIVVSSPQAHLGTPGSMAYNMAKAANDQMARTAACELAHHNIRVNIIHPGWTDTPGERKFFSEETLASEGSKIPMGRLGKPEEIGRAAVFLCDPESRYITGSTLTVDGGIQLPWREMYRVHENVS